MYFHSVTGKIFNLVYLLLKLLNNKNWYIIIIMRSDGIFFAAPDQKLLEDEFRSRSRFFPINQTLHLKATKCFVIEHFFEDFCLLKVSRERNERL